MKKENRRLSNKGFTLIELLAVITIMGILMMVAIPAVSRTIENARRDTFADIAHEYINAVRNSMLADNIECYDTTDWHVASANPSGIYYFPICTSESNCAQTGSYILAEDGSTTMVEKSTLAPITIVQSTSDLMESGGKSPFGNSEMQGYVKIAKEVDTITGKTTLRYTIKLMDSGGHGIATDTQESQVKRSAISVSATPDTDSNILTSGTISKIEIENGEYKLDESNNKIITDEKVGAKVCKVS